MTSPRALPPLTAGCRWQLPPYVDTVLPGGLRVIAVRAPSVPMTDFRLRIPAPTCGGTGQAALHLLADQLLHATGRRGFEDIDELLGRTGTMLAAGYDNRWVSVAGSAPVHALHDVLDLVSEALNEPAYREGPTGQAAARLTARRAALSAQPRALAQDVLRRRLYGPGVHPLLPEPAAVEQAGPEAILRLHRKVLRPDGAFLVLVGDIDPEAEIRHLTQILDHRPPAAAPPPPHRTARYVPGIEVTDRPGSRQSQLLFAAPALPRLDPRFAALSLANCVLGGYFSSRLMAGVRERSGLAYRIDSSLQELLDDELVLIDADTGAATTPEAVRQIGQELLALSERPPTAAETDAAREYFIGMLFMNSASQAALSASLANLLSYGLDPAWLEAFPEQLRDTTGRDVAAAAELYRPERFSGVIVGPREILGSQDFSLCQPPAVN